MSERFDWAGATKDAVVHQQSATAVYWNEAGGITIRQEGDAFDDDAIIALTAPNAAELARFILTDILGQERSIAFLSQIWTPDGKPKRRRAKPNDRMLGIAGDGSPEAAVGER